MIEEARNNSILFPVIPSELKLFSFWGLIIIFLAISLASSFLCDDAFITFRVARNLATGAGPVFNPGEHVEGYTSFSWMVIMAAVIKLGCAPELWSRILSIMFSIGTILIFLSSLRNDGGQQRFLFAAFLTFSAPFLAWSTGGMETGAYTFFLFGGLMMLLASLKSQRDCSFVITSLLFSLSALTRPEGVLVFAIIFGFLIALAILKRVSVRQVVLILLPFIIIYGVYSCWRISYYGRLFPNTFYVKAPGNELIGLGLAYYWDFFKFSAVWLPLAYVVYHSLRTRHVRFYDFDILLISLFLVYSIYVIYAGGDFMVLSRFLMPILPMLYFLFYRLYNSAIENKLRERISILPVIALALFLISNTCFIIKAHKKDYGTNLDSIYVLKNYVVQWSEAGHLIAQNSLSTDTIAVTAAGAIPYYSKLYTIDMFGLEAPDLSKYTFNDIISRPGHVMTIAPHFLFASRPQFIIGHPKIVKGLSDRNPFGKAQDIGPELLKGYTAASAQLPGNPGYFLEFWVRNDVVSRTSKDIRFYNFVE